MMAIASTTTSIPWDIDRDVVMMSTSFSRVETLEREEQDLYPR
jgi:hypothetical protein